MTNRQNVFSKKNRKVLLLAAVVILGGAAGWAWLQGHKSDSQLSALRYPGQPVSASELDRWYASVPAAENAAMKIQQAMAGLVAPQAVMAWPITNEVVTPEMEQLLAQLVRDNAEPLKLLRQAAALKQSRFPINLGSGLTVQLPHLSPMMQAAQVLQRVALHHSLQGNAGEALECYFDSLGSSRALSQEPILISELVRIACVALAQRTLERLLNHHQFSEEQFAQMLQALRQTEAEGRESLRRALIGERCFGFDIFRRPRRGLAQAQGFATSTSAIESSATEALFLLRRLSGIHGRDLRLYRETMDGYIQAAQLPFPEALIETKRHSARMPSFGRTMDRIVYTISGLILPAMTKAVTKEARIAAELRLAQAAILVERQRAGRSAAPVASLTKLAEDSLSIWPKDPFDGKPVRYQRLEAGYRVYSVGEDETDDGGNPKTDLCFSVRR
ncbi:MAG: hypothetical protein HY735_37025 [Verrucomicrobia bacterium]|nr:hypothetical protein [Verrucomicrobiota bacterium]